MNKQKKKHHRMLIDLNQISRLNPNNAGEPNATDKRNATEKTKHCHFVYKPVLRGQSIKLFSSEDNRF